MAVDGSCKVLIYNYVLCWLYSMTKNIVIALIYFLVFSGILLYWVRIKLAKIQAKMKNQWISREVREKLTRERAT